MKELFKELTLEETRDTIFELDYIAINLFGVKNAKQIESEVKISKGLNIWEMRKDIMVDTLDELTGILANREGKSVANRIVKEAIKRAKQ